MALENAQWIAELVTVNPEPDDGVGAGDDHLRMLKTVLANTFVGEGTDTWDAGSGALLAGPVFLSTLVNLQDGTFALTLANDQSLTGRNFADTANVDIVKVNVSDQIEFGSHDVLLNKRVILLNDNLTVKDQFALVELSATEPGINFDAGDYHIYNRATDAYDWYIGSVAEASLSASGLFVGPDIVGRSRILADSAILAMEDFLTTPGFFSMDATAVDTPALNMDNGDYYAYNRTTNTHFWVIGGTSVFDIKSSVATLAAKLDVVRALGATPDANPDVSELATFTNSDKAGDDRVLTIATDENNAAVLRAVGTSGQLSGGEWSTEFGMEAATALKSGDLAGVGNRPVEADADGKLVVGAAAAGFTPVVMCRVNAAGALVGDSTNVGSIQGTTSGGMRVNYSSAIINNNVGWQISVLNVLAYNVTVTNLGSSFTDIRVHDQNNSLVDAEISLMIYEMA